jgi:glutamate-1-semialdehyde aminotransferase
MRESARLLERARRVIPMGTQTLSKSAGQWVHGVAPNYVARARGAHVWDVDGNRFIDFPMALGPVILGHAWPSVNAAIAAQLDDGITYTLPHPLEIDLAERILGDVPGVERVRFGKTGSDVTSAAIRVARAHTGRAGVLVGGYHGWHDWYIASTSRNAGVPDAVRRLTDTFTYGDLASLDDALARQGGDTAAVILEPAGASEPEPGYLQAVVDRARAAGAVAVFDEIITGFRLARGGAQERYGVEADLVTFGKALGNGMPISALAGRADIMERLEEVFFSGTHGGEVLSITAAMAVLDELTPEAYEHLYRLGSTLADGVQAAIARHGLEGMVAIGGAAPRTVVTVTEPAGQTDRLPAKTLVQQELAKRGVLFNGSNFICLAHTDEDIAQAVDAYDGAFDLLAGGLASGDIDSMLEGPALQPAFRKIS